MAEKSKQIEEEINKKMLEKFSNEFPQFLSQAEQESSLENIDKCKNLLNECLSVLASYQIQKAQNSILQLEKKNQQKPRIKFQFTRQKHVKEQNKIKEVASEEVKQQQVVPDFQDLQNQQISLSRDIISEKGTINLKQLTGCEVILLGKLQNLHLFNLQNCVLKVGCIAGALHVNNCIGCEIQACAHQIRIHETRDTKFYLIARSGPIVENVSNVGFGVYSLQYPELDQDLLEDGISKQENRWNEVNDFKWLKQTSSPNFYYF